MIVCTLAPPGARCAITWSAGVPVSSMTRRSRRVGVGFTESSCALPSQPSCRWNTRRTRREGARFAPAPGRDARFARKRPVRDTLGWHEPRNSAPEEENSVTRQGRILVVDDEVNARTALAELLRDEGFEVETAADAFKAL